MLYVRSLVILVCATFIVSAAADEKKYVSKEGKFAVAFPADAKVKTDKKDAGGFTLNLTSVTANNIGYVVIYAQLPDQLKSVDAKVLLDGVEKGSLKDSGGKLIKSKDVEFGKNKYPAREVLSEKDGNKVQSWIVIADSRLFVVGVGGPKDFATSKEATAFLESFEITK